MIADFIDIIWGCWHSNYSFPITAKVGQRSKAAQVTGTYVVCLDCGKEFAYDWKEMRVITTPRKPDLEMQENEVLVGGRIQ